MQEKYRCVLVANGLFPSGSEALGALRDAEFVAACDGAVLKMDGFRQPDVIVGDLDSLPPRIQKRYADKIHRVDEQETNDLTKAVNYVRDLGYDEVLLLGTTGLREDHTLGNISLLMDYAPFFKRIEILSDYGRFTPITHTTVFNSVPGQQISIFSLQPQQLISADGLRYPIEKRCFNRWWEATLNEAVDETFTVIIDDGAEVLVYRALDCY